MSAGTALRTSRAAVFALLSVLLSAGGRLLVTGRALPTPTLLIAGLAVLASAWFLAGAERRYAQIAALLIPVELTLNALFNAAQERCVGAGPGGWPGLLICGGGAVRPGLPGIGPTHGPGALADGQVLLLLTLHLVVALAMAGWLRRGEVAVFAVLRAASALSRTGLSGLSALLAWLAAPAPTPLPPIWRTPPSDPPRPASRDVLRRTPPRRGPPVLAPAC